MTWLAMSNTYANERLNMRIIRSRFLKAENKEVRVVIMSMKDVVFSTLDGIPFVGICNCFAEDSIPQLYAAAAKDRAFRLRGNEPSPVPIWIEKGENPTYIDWS